MGFGVFDFEEEMERGGGGGAGDWHGWPVHRQSEICGVTHLGKLASQLISGDINHCFAISYSRQASVCVFCQTRGNLCLSFGFKYASI